MEMARLNKCVAKNIDSRRQTPKRVLVLRKKGPKLTTIHTNWCERWSRGGTHIVNFQFSHTVIRPGGRCMYRYHRGVNTFQTRLSRELWCYYWQRIGVCLPAVVKYRAEKRYLSIDRFFGLRDVSIPEIVAFERRAHPSDMDTNLRGFTVCPKYVPLAALRAGWVTSSCRPARNGIVTRY